MKPTAKSQEPRAAKITLRAIVLLLLGAVVNVAVAWGFAMAVSTASFGSSSRHAGGYFAGEGNEVWVVNMYERPGAAYLIAVKLRADQEDSGRSLQREVVPEWSHLIRLRDDAGRASPPSPLHEWGWGWPSLALRHARGSRSVEVPKWLGRSGAGRTLPLGILPRGFAVNTLFYAGVLWLLLFGPFAARRMVRRRRGRCPQCGYSLEGITSDKCPECGKERPA